MWFTSLQPTRQRADSYEARFAAGIVTFRRHDHGIDTPTDIAVSADDNVELRRVRITNHSNARRVLDVTSYAEIALAPAATGAATDATTNAATDAATDAAHPAFNKRFVQIEIQPDLRAILCTHRARDPDDPAPWMFHLLTATGPADAELTFETDRLKFVGRGRSTADPQTPRPPDPLS